jgi:hypothetical protein
MRGPALPGAHRGSSVTPTPQVIDTANRAYGDFARAAADWLDTHPDATIKVMVTAFSRGDSSAAIFSQLLYERGLIDPRTNKVLVPAGEIGINGGVIFDPVDTGVQGNLAYAPNTENLVVARAENEYRYLFKAADHANQPGITTYSVAGNHGDVGGGLDNGLGGIMLNSATNYFRVANLPIAEVPQSRQFDSASPVLIHTAAVDEYGHQLWTEYGGFDAGTARLATKVATPESVRTTMDGTQLGTFVDVLGNRVTSSSATADGLTRERITVRDADGHVLSDMTMRTSTDGSEMSVSVDRNGDGMIDQFESTKVAGDGVTTDQSRDYYANGQLRLQSTITTRADGSLLKEETTNIAESGQRTVVVKDFGSDDALVSAKVTLTSADGHTVSITTDADGNGSVDKAQTLFTDADGSKLNDTRDYDPDGSLRDQRIVQTSADGKAITVRTDADGDAHVEKIETIVTDALGNRIVNLQDLNMDGSLKDAQTVTSSADGSTISTSRDSDGNGHADSIITATTTAQGTVNNTRLFDAAGELTFQRTITANADGLSKSTETDGDGNGHIDQIILEETDAAGTHRTDQSDFGPDGKLGYERVVSKTVDAANIVTSVDRDGNGHFDTIQSVERSGGTSIVDAKEFDAEGRLTMEKNVLKTDDGRQTVVSLDNDGNGGYDQVTTTLIEGDGGKLGDVRQFDEHGHLTYEKSVEVSADERTVTSSEDGNGDGHDEFVKVVSTDADGTRTVKLSNFDVNGALLDKTITVANASGTSTTVSRDTDGDGQLNDSRTKILGSDGSTTVEVTIFNSDGSLNNTKATITDANGFITQREVTTTDSGQTYHEVKVFAANDSSRSVSWTRSDGTYGSSSADAYGNYEEMHTDTDGSMHSRFKSADGTSGGTDLNGDGSGTGYSRGIGGARSDTTYNADASSHTSFRLATTNSEDPRSGITGFKDMYADGGSRILEKYLDGSTREMIVRADKTSHMEYHNTDGSSGWADSLPSGSSITFDKRADGAFQKTVDDGHGSVRTDYDNLNGSYGWQLASPDGTRTSYQHQSDGSTYEVHTAANGTTVTAYKNADGAFGSGTENTDGSYQWDWQYADGTHGGAARSANGDRVMYAFDSHGNSMIDTIHADGSRKIEWAIEYGAHGTRSTDAAGTVTEFSTIHMAGYNLAGYRMLTPEHPLDPSSGLMEVTVDVSYTKVATANGGSSHIDATWASNVTSDVQTFDESTVNWSYDHSVWTVYGEPHSVLLNGRPNYPDYSQGDILSRTTTIFPVIDQLHIIAVGTPNLSEHYQGAEPVWATPAPHIN